MNEIYECEECHDEFKEEETVVWENEYGLQFELCKKCAKKSIKEDGGKIICSSECNRKW